MPDPNRPGPAPWLARCDRALASVERLLLSVAALCGLALVCVTAVDVVGRYVFGQALGWAYDTALVLMIGLVFLSISSIQAARGHVAVELLYQQLPATGRFCTSLLHFAIGAFAFGTIGLKNVQYALEAASKGWVYGGFGAIPTWLPYSFIGVGCLLLALRLVLQFVMMLSAGRSASALQASSTAQVPT